MEPYKVKIGNLRAERDPVFVLLPSDSRPTNYYYSHTIMNPTFTRRNASGLKYYAHMMVRDQFRKPPGAIFPGNFLAVTVILLKLSLKDPIDILWTMEKKHFQITFKKYNILLFRKK